MTGSANVVATMVASTGVAVAAMPVAIVEEPSRPVGSSGGSNGDDCVGK